jgi:2-polyprenyl-3-methyl-5-hydroxy-6-metoxy-1,4-benzoquinol methylase
MVEINATARQCGWNAALIAKLQPTYPDIYRYVVDSSRADWHFSLPVDRLSSTVLDIGSGWGILSFSLANFFHEVVSLEAVQERIEFQSIRRTQDGATNIRLVRANLIDEPFETKPQFDAIAMNGVLEWLGLSDFSRNPGVVQLDALRYTQRLLKPGGALYVGIENRTGGNMFLGTKDHTDLRFTSLMPRRLASLYMKFLNRKEFSASKRTDRGLNEYRTYTYTYWGYMDLLRRAGFERIEIHLVLPTYSWPKYVIPLKSNAALSYFFRNFSSAESWKDKVIVEFGRLAHMFRLTKLFAPDFLIIARKP